MELICNIHDEIQSVLNDIEINMKYAKDCLIEIQNHSEEEFSINKAEDSLSNLEDAIWNISKIPNLVEEAKECGIKMENRLIDYKSAIEDLGFTRVK